MGNEQSINGAKTKKTKLDPYLIDTRTHTHTFSNWISDLYKNQDFLAFKRKHTRDYIYSRYLEKMHLNKTWEAQAIKGKNDQCDHIEMIF